MVDLIQFYLKLEDIAKGEEESHLNFAAQQTFKKTENTRLKMVLFCIFSLLHSGDLQSVTRLHVASTNEITLLVAPKNETS